MRLTTRLAMGLVVSLCLSVGLLAQGEVRRANGIPSGGSSGQCLQRSTGSSLVWGACGDPLPQGLDTTDSPTFAGLTTEVLKRRDYHYPWTVSSITFAPKTLTGAATSYTKTETTQVVDLGFTLNYGGVDYTQVCVFSDGGVQLGPTCDGGEYPTFEQVTYPPGGYYTLRHDSMQPPPPRFIGAPWTLLDDGMGAGTATFKTETQGSGANHYLIVNWSADDGNVMYSDGVTPFTSQIVIYENGSGGSGGRAKIEVHSTSVTAATYSMGWTDGGPSQADCVYCGWARGATDSKSNTYLLSDAAAEGATVDPGAPLTNVAVRFTEGEPVDDGAVTWLTANPSTSDITLTSIRNVTFTDGSTPSLHLSLLDNNVFLGWGAGFSNSLDNPNSSNVFIGTETGYYNTTGVNNTFVGVNSGLYSTTGDNNAFFGRDAGGNNTTGSANTAIGLDACYNTTTGESNTCIGAFSLWFQTLGSNNVALGWGAGVSFASLNVMDNPAQDSINDTDMVFLGRNATRDPGGSIQVDMTDGIAIGANAFVTASHHAVLGAATITDVFLGSESATAILHAASLKGFGVSACPMGQSAPVTLSTDDTGNITLTRGSCS